MSATHQTIGQMARGACLHISTSSDWSLRQSPYRDCFCHSQTFGQTASFKANRVIFGCPADLIGAAVRRCRSGRTADRLCPQQQFVAAVRGSVLSRIRHGGNRHGRVISVARRKQICARFSGFRFLAVVFASALYVADGLVRLRAGPFYGSGCWSLQDYFWPRCFPQASGTASHS